LITNTRREPRIGVFGGVFPVKQNNLMKSHQAVFTGGPDGIRTRDMKEKAFLM
jgi:hypothetical protein